MGREVRVGADGWRGGAQATYIIVYGQMQAFTPQLVLQPLKQSPPNKFVEIIWGFANMIPVRPPPS